MHIQPSYLVMSDDSIHEVLALSPQLAHFCPLSFAGESNLLYAACPWSTGGKFVHGLPLDWPMHEIFLSPVA